MKWIIRILEVILLTYISGVIYYIVKYLIHIPPEPNMYWIGTVIASSIYTFVNVLFILLVYLISHKTNKQIHKKLFTFKYLQLEIIFLYMLIEIISYIPYTFNILPISNFTEKDLFQVFTPFIILSILWVIVRMIKTKVPYGILKSTSDKSK